MQPEIDAAASNFFRSGSYMLGLHVQAFEREWARAVGGAHGVGVGNGTDALLLALRAAGVGPGDEVITVPNAAGYTAFALRIIGACPVYADVDPQRWTLDPADVVRRITPRTKLIVPVHLYGCPANLTALSTVAADHQLPIIEDCAQAHAAMWQNRPVGSWGLASCWSFYPTKNLGALGDAGAVVTSDAAFAERVRQLRQYGWDEKYHAVLPYGGNSRLDELQAAFLRAKLPHLPEWTARRRAIAARYRSALQNVPDLVLPIEDPGHVYHLYVVRVLHGRRAAIQAALTQAGIGTTIHYPLLDQEQPALQQAGVTVETTPIAAKLAREILSLPCFPELSDDEVDTVVQAVRVALSFDRPVS